MAEVVWTHSALQDLNDIAEYIALDNEAAAEKLVKSVFNKTDRLSEFPLSGRVPPELQSSVYREVIASPCRIIYREQDDTVNILFVFREEREFRAYLLNEN